jgi:hypothetical protein
LKGLRVSKAPSASAYFCISDLARHWPSTDRTARRVVVMITDGVEPFLQPFDPDDQYVQAAINDAARADVAVYSIFWSTPGASIPADLWSGGQSLLQELAEASGGKSYWTGMSNPVSFQSYFEEITRRLQNQYELRFTAQLSGKPKVESLKVKVSGAADAIDAPRQVYVSAAGAGE